MPRQLAVLGGGEHARVVVDAARSRPDAWSLVGFIGPDEPSEQMARMGVEHMGDDDTYLDRLRAAEPADRPTLVVGVGSDAALRRSLVTRYGPLATWATLVHATAWASPSAEIEPGAVVLAHAVVNTGARVRAHAIVNTGAIVEHDVEVGLFAHIGPGAAIGGGSTVGDGAFVGLGARVRDHISIGADAVIGMGAVVVEQVPAGSVVMGVPARARTSVGG